MKIQIRKHIHPVWPGVGNKNNFRKLHLTIYEDNNEWITIRQTGNNIESLHHRY